MAKIGSYEIISQIGEGAFGRTFRGKHAILGVPVCIKQEKTGKEPYMGLFREESMIVARLRHPSLPSFMDYMEMPPPIGQVLILSFVEGNPLDKVIRVKTTIDGSVAQWPISDEHICWIVDRLLGALSYLHGKWNIVHCDVKPGNVILDIPDHNATLVDLGMASFKPDEWSKAKGGTAGYLPPEFGTGFSPIPESDIYSVGKIVCAISGGDANKGEFNKDMHPGLKEFFESWIRHDPAQRPSSADLLRNQLAKLRVSIWGRDYCKEEFKYRYKEHQHKYEEHQQYKMGRNRK